MRSFGTEDRPTDRPAPPREEIYEYIIFRGSDIKDITVCEPPKAQHTLPQDPAIVQVSAGPCSCAGRLPASRCFLVGLGVIRVARELNSGGAFPWEVVNFRLGRRCHGGLIPVAVACAGE